MFKIAKILYTENQLSCIAKKDKKIFILKAA